MFSQNTDQNLKYPLQGNISMDFDIQDIWIHKVMLMLIQYSQVDWNLQQ